MRSWLLAVGFSLFAVPVWAAGLPQLQLPALGGATPHAVSPTSTSLPLAPVVADLGLSTPGVGGPLHFAPNPTVLPGLADVTPYVDNTGTGGRLNADVEADTYGQGNPLVIYGLAFTDPPQHPLHLVGNLAGIPIDQRVDAP